VANVDLNAINRDIAGGRLGRNAPRFRTCGLRVDLQVFFTNKDGDTDKPLYNAKTIHATATASAATGLWSGRGPRTVYEVYPSGDHGAMTYDKVFVYAQGSMVKVASLQCHSWPPVGLIRLHLKA